MLIRSETRYVPTAVNMLVLQGQDGAFYYVHRSLYDQCVILRDQYRELLESFYKLLGATEGHPAVCDTFMESVPEPLDILGPFLSLITDADKLEDVTEMCGALSSMSMTVDFRKMFRVPAAVRASIKFSLSVREEYKVQWDRFFMETPTLEQVTSVPSAVTTTVSSNGDTFELVGEADSPEDILADLFADWDTPSTEAAPEANDVEEEEVVEEEEPKAKSGFAMLKGLK